MTKRKLVSIVMLTMSVMLITCVWLASVRALGVTVSVQSENYFEYSARAKLGGSTFILFSSSRVVRLDREIGFSLSQAQELKHKDIITMKTLSTIEHHKGPLYAITKPKDRRILFQFLLVTLVREAVSLLLPSCENHQGAALVILQP